MEPRTNPLQNPGTLFIGSLVLREVSGAVLTKPESLLLGAARDKWLQSICP